MATDNSASVLKLPQPVKRAMTGAERTRKWRKAKKENGPPLERPVSTLASPTGETPAGAALIKQEAPLYHIRGNSIAPSRVTLVTAALALAIVGVTMNGTFARSLGSSDLAGWLFLAVGVASDAVALAIPSCAASLWASRQRGIALVAWGVFLMTFVFAITAGIGFASVNISDVTMARASRVTPAVTAAQSALADATAARDRECRGGVGKFCREREAQVADRRAALDAAMKAVAETGDPQAMAAIHMVSWLTAGKVKPTEDDFAMLRLVLLALLPQIGGILLMVGRAKCSLTPHSSC